MNYTQSDYIYLLEIHLPLWAEARDAASELYNGIKDLFGSSPESKFAMSLWKSFENYTKSLQDIFETDFLDWYCYENDMGKKGLSVVINKINYKITSLDSLIDIIVKYKFKKSKIIINGVDHVVIGEVITYSEICMLSGVGPYGHPTVTYRHGINEEQGSFTSIGSVQVVDGMIFNCIRTNNA